MKILSYWDKKSEWAIRDANNVWMEKKMAGLNGRRGSDVKKTVL